MGLLSLYHTRKGGDELYPSHTGNLHSCQNKKRKHQVIGNLYTKSTSECKCIGQHMYVHSAQWYMYILAMYLCYTWEGAPMQAAKVLTANAKPWTNKFHIPVTLSVECQALITDSWRIWAKNGKKTAADPNRRWGIFLWRKWRICKCQLETLT